MYPRNAASPPRIAVGAVVQISDGAVQGSGVSIAVRPNGGSESAGAGTTTYGGSSSIVYYAPTQGETDYTDFVVTAYKTGCIPVSVTVITTASATAGNAGLDWGKVINPTTTVTLSGTTVKTATDVETDTADIQTRLPAALVSGRIDASVGAMAANVLTAAAAAADFGSEIQALVTGGAYTLDTDANGRIRIVDGTAAGELDTSSGLVTLTAASVADINATVDTALTDIRLDELLAADSDIDGLTPPTVGSVFHELMTKTAGSFTYDQTTDSLEALRDRGDAAWITATGFSTHSAADVWAVATRVLTAATNISGPIADQVWEETLADHSGTAGSTAEALNAAGAAGDPWTTALPGAYGAGSAGNIIGNYLTGNAYTRLGAPAGASIAADIAAVKADTAAILLDTGTDGVVVNAAGLATDAVQEIRNAITGGAYALSTDALGMVRIVDGVGTGEIDTSTGGVNANRIGGASQSGVDLGTILSSVTARIPTALDADGNMLATVASFNSGAGYLSDEGAINLTVFFNDGGNTDGIHLGDLPLYSEVLNLHRLGLRKDSALATDLAALVTTVNANLGTGGGTFANTTDSLEAQRDIHGTPTNLNGFGATVAGNLQSLDDTLSNAISNALNTIYGDTQAILADTGTTLDGYLNTLLTRVGVPASSLAADIAALNDIAAADVWAVATRTLTAGTNLNDITAADVWTHVVENSNTAEELLRGLSALAMAKASGGGSAPVFRNLADTKNRISMTVDASGNRTAVTRDLT